MRKGNCVFSQSFNLYTAQFVKIGNTFMINYKNKKTIYTSLENTNAGEASKFDETSINTKKFESKM